MSTNADQIAREQQKAPDTHERVISENVETAPDNRPARKWSYSRKLCTTLLVGSFRFVSSLAASSPSFALPDIASEFATTNSQLAALPLSVYILGYVIGPLLIAPLSSTFGRVRVLQGSNLLFVVFNTAAGLARHNAALIVFRFFSGIGGSGPVTLGIGILSDCWTAKERTRMISVYTLPVQLGPALAPIIGAFTTKYLSWRWSFFIISIASGVVQTCGAICLRETHVPHIRETSNKASKVIPLARELTEALQRPIRIFTLHATTQLLAVYAALTYGIVYMAFVSFHRLWVHEYGQPSDLASLNFLSIAVGEIVGSLGIRPFNEWSYKKMQARSQDPTSAHPEYRTPALIFGALLMPIGLVTFGWSAQALTSPVIPNLGVALYAAGEVIVLQFTSLYVADVYEGRSTDAVTGIYILRCFVAFLLSLVTSNMFRTLGYGFGNTLLAGVAVVLGWPLPWLIWRYGAKLRRRDMKELEIGG